MRLLESQAKASGEKVRTIHEIFDSKESDLDQYLHFDEYRRASFLDHFISEPIDFESFQRGRYQEEGDFIQGLYGMDLIGQGRGREVLFSRSGCLCKNGKKDPLKIGKRMVPSPVRSSLKAFYRLTYGGEGKRRTNFGIEFNINLLAGNAPDRYYLIPGHQLEDRKLASIGEHSDVSEVRLIDEWNRMEVILTTDKNCNLWRFPVETVSLSESGFERIFQGSCLLFYWPLELEPGKQFEVDIELGIKPL
jgi:alpha-amylase